MPLAEKRREWKLALFQKGGGCSCGKKDGKTKTRKAKGQLQLKKSSELLSMERELEDTDSEVEDKVDVEAPPDEVFNMQTCYVLLLESFLCHSFQIVFSKLAGEDAGRPHPVHDGQGGLLVVERRLEQGQWCFWQNFPAGRPGHWAGLASSSG